jgi:hypothetical protein
MVRPKAENTPGELGRVVMMFLLRAAFWLGVVLVLLPSGGTKSDAQTQVSAAEAVTAASAAVSDMGQFCSRQPTACEVGGQAAVALGQRAQAGARMLFEFFSERGAHEPTGSIGVSGKAVPASQHTLQPSDVTPAWRGPRKDLRQPA